MYPKQNRLLSLLKMQEFKHALMLIVLMSWIVCDAGSVAANGSAALSSPQLNLIMPRGVQRGHEHVLTFSGARLQETQEVFLYSEGVTVLKFEQVDANNVKVTVRVAPECRLGEHVAQLRTNYGISEFRTFFVGALPAVAEVEPNNEFEKPQSVALNHTIAGTITSEDVDYFQIDVKQGLRVSIEIEAIRLGGALIDPYIAVLDEKRFEIHARDDTRLLKQDCFVSFVPQADATYTVLVRDASYGGDGNCRYRLHVGDFPRPTLSYPAGGQIGTETELQLLGDPTGPLEHKMKVVAPGRSGSGIYYADEQGVTPSAIAFRPSELPNAMEAEPNSGFNNCTKVTLPCALNGKLQEPGDLDWYGFECKKGQVYDFEVYAQRINSPLDVAINVYGTDKKHIQGNDDSRGADPYYRFTAPADGLYYLRVRDLLGRGGEQFIYRVEVAAPKPALSIGIPRVARYSQYRQSIFVAQGNRFATQISATRANFGGELKLLQDQLPAGITMHARPMAANLNLMPVVFEASADAELTGKLVDLISGHVDDSKEIKGGYRNTGQMVSGPPNNAMYVGCDVDRLPMAVVKPLPFKIDIVQPQAPLVREGSLKIKVVATRDEGFTAPITLQFPFRPPGVGTRGTVVIPEGKTEAWYPLNANGNAQIREWPIYVLANSNVGGNAWASSQLATLNVTERMVTMGIARAACEQGQTTQFICKLNHVSPFEGQAKAELLGIPPHTEVQAMTFDKTTEELVFTVKTQPKTPVGKHTGVFCRVRIPYQGESIVATAGRSELQVDKPLAKPQVAAKATEAAANAEPKPAAKKPLSRLEKLRQAARQQSEQKGKQ